MDAFNIFTTAYAIFCIIAMLFAFVISPSFIADSRTETPVESKTSSRKILKKLASQKGRVTITELAIVFAILGIVTTLVYSRIPNSIGQTEVKTENKTTEVEIYSVPLPEDFKEAISFTPGGANEFPCLTYINQAGNLSAMSYSHKLSPLGIYTFTSQAPH